MKFYKFPQIHRDEFLMSFWGLPIVLLWLGLYFWWISDGFVWALLSFRWFLMSFWWVFCGFCWVYLRWWVSDDFLLSFGCSDSAQIQQNLNKISTEIAETQQKRNHRNSTDSTQIQQSSYRAVVATSAISAGWDLVITTLKPPFRDTRTANFHNKNFRYKKSGSRFEKNY